MLAIAAFFILMGRSDSIGLLSSRVQETCQSDSTFYSRTNSLDKQSLALPERLLPWADFGKFASPRQRNGAEGDSFFLGLSSGSSRRSQVSSGLLNIVSGASACWTPSVSFQNGSLSIHFSNRQKAAGTVFPLELLSAVTDPSWIEAVTLNDANPFARNMFTDSSGESSASSEVTTITDNPATPDTPQPDTPEVVPESTETTGDSSSVTPPAEPQFAREALIIQNWRVKQAEVVDQTHIRTEARDYQIVRTLPESLLGDSGILLMDDANRDGSREAYWVARNSGKMAVCADYGTGWTPQYFCAVPAPVSAVETFYLYNYSAKQMLFYSKSNSCLSICDNVGFPEMKPLFTIPVSSSLDGIAGVDLDGNHVDDLLLFSVLTNLGVVMRNVDGLSFQPMEETYAQYTRTLFRFQPMQDDWRSVMLVAVGNKAYVYMANTNGNSRQLAVLCQMKSNEGFVIADLNNDGILEAMLATFQ